MTTLAPPALTPPARTPTGQPARRRRWAPVLIAVLALVAACGPAESSAGSSLADSTATAAATTATAATASTGDSASPAAAQPTRIPGIVSVAAAAPVHGDESITWDGIRRSAATWKPGLQKAPMPLLVVLAGRGSGPLGEQMRTHLNLLADQGKAVVIFPRQIGRSWNAGRCCDDAKADDSGFLAALVQQLIVEGVADPHRVYVSGFSVGGMMAYRLACDHPAMFAGIASVGGVSVSSCPAHFRVPLLEVHSRVDSEVPLGGNHTSALTGKGAAGLPSVGATVQNWRIRNSCTSNLYVGHPAIVGPLEIRTVPGCPGDAGVQLVQTRIPGHAWAGPGVDTTSMVWAFLSRQAR